MQELLAAADMLITDYSSCIWDYSFLYRPCFLYTPDLREYLAKTGFYVDIHEWPFPICENMEDLEKQMKQEFDADKRSDLAIQMQQTILDDNAYVFCSHLRMSMIMQSNVTGLTAHPCDYYELTADLDIN